MSGRVILAVDGGNSKTDLALAGEDGRVLALVRGPGCSPHRIGVDGCIEVIAGLLEEARADAGIAGAAAAAAVMVAGADLDSEEQALRAQLDSCRWAEQLEIGNDTLAVLRAGSESGHGIAVVCGAGINALGLAPDGRTARFPALGPITGDWGGGDDLGLAALGRAVRADDGRGAATVLTEIVPLHFSLGSAEEVALAIHGRDLDQARLVELAPLVLEAADDGDLAAIELRQRLVEEVVALVRAAAGRVLAGVEHYEVVLGGSLLSRSATLGRLASERVKAVLPEADPKVCSVLPVAGSAVVALEAIGAREQAATTLRRELALDRAVVATNRNGAVP